MQVGQILTRISPSHLAPGRAVPERRPARPRRKAVLAGVAIRTAARARQVAAAVIAQRRRPRARQLVEPVARLAAIDVEVPVPGIEVVGPHLRRDLTRGVVDHAVAVRKPAP